MNDDGDSLSTNSSDYFVSPFAAYRQVGVTKRSETLPENPHDSWIGARRSPIPFQDEDEEEDDEETAVYRKTLESIEASFLVNERSALLGGSASASREWTREAATQTPKSTTFVCQPPRCYWETVVWVLSGIQLGCIGLHDLYLWYISFRLGYKTDIESWRLPWLTPSDTVLQRFGAFLPYRLLFQREWWRMVTSIVMTTSVVEWLLIYGCWKALRVSGCRPTRMWVWIYLLSVFTGQTWMMAWNAHGISGGASWGTCGVLCATSGAKPRQRFVLLCFSMGLFLLSLLEPTTSLIGTIGTSLFGYFFYRLGFSKVVSSKDKDFEAPPKGLSQFASGVVLLLVWILPLLWIAFRKLEESSQPMTKG